MTEYSSQLCQYFNDYKFSKSFLINFQNFFQDTYFITHAQYIAINNRLSNDYLKSFSSDIDVLIPEALNTLYEYTITSLENIINFYEKNIIEFQDIQFASGETHNGKKSILIIQIDDKKIIYRPYDMTQLKLLSQIFYTIEDTLTYDLDIFPKIIYFSKEYSIIEYLETTPIIDNNKFYYSVGVCLAFTHCMRIVDLYADNILFHNDSVAIVDAEASFYRNAYEKDFKISFSGLIGSYFSGLNDGSGQDFSIRLDVNQKASFLIKTKKGKEDLDIQGYTTQIRNGFTDCYTSFIENKEKILNLTFLENAQIRHIIRPTKVYTNWLISLFTPNINLKNNISKLYSEMNTYQLGEITEDFSKDIVKKELSDLLLTDVPYFYCDFQSRSLYHNGEVVVENFHKRDFYDFFTEHISNINETQLPALLKELEQLIDEHETYNKT